MREYSRQQTAILLRRLAFQLNRAARNGDAEAIHDVRVAIRRLSRGLRVFAQFYPDDSWKRIRRRLSRLMTMAGEVRDRDIARELLAQAGVPPRAAVVARLQAERATARHELLQEIRRWKNRNFYRKWRTRLGM
ncbi:MAG: CHAD domain-containing protein [Acidobacteriia bacterium]|nr:CHAD domain-containing protein [Terriglobia bacterium]